MIEKDNLIKYLENCIEEEIKFIDNFASDPYCGATDCYLEDRAIGRKQAYRDILERVKSGKYE